MKSRSRDQDGLGAGRPNTFLTGTSLLFKKSHDPGYDCKQAATAREEQGGTSTECSELVPLLKTVGYPSRSNSGRLIDHTTSHRVATRRK